MIVVTRLSDIPSSLAKPCALTIGSFDGLHLGHQALVQQMQKRLFHRGTLGLLTFSNHPAHILPHRKSAPLLCSMDQKLELLKKLGVDLVILLEFSRALSESSYEEFLTALRQVFPFKFLILGEGARVGKGQEGDEKKIKELGLRLHFEAEYFPKTMFEEEIISSGRIRHSIEMGDFKKAEQMLGRPYIIDGVLSFDIKNQRQAWIDLNGRCLPKAQKKYNILVRQHRLNCPAQMHIDLSSERVLIIFSQNEPLPITGPVEICFE